MNRLPILAALFAASTLAFVSCSNDAADDADDADTTMVITDPVPADGSTMTTTENTMTATTNPDGTVTYSDGVVRGTDGSYKRADGTVLTAEEVKPYESVQGATITTDGTVKDRDGDGRVGTAEVKEEYKQGRDAVKDEYKDIKKDVKD